MPTTRLSDAFDEFYVYGRSNFAEGTVKGVRSSLTNLLTDVGNIYVQNLTITHIDRWTDARRAAGVSPLTVRNNLTHLGMFCTWARDRKLAPKTWDPIGRRHTPHSVPTQFQRIPASKFPALLDAARDECDRVVIAIGLYLFLRASEIKALRVGDVNLEQGWVAVKIFKSGKKDLMPISAELHDELHRWLAAYRSAMDVDILDPEWYLAPAGVPFGSLRGADGRMMRGGGLRLRPDSSPAKIHWAVHRALKTLGMDSSKEGVHTLRRSAARARFDQLVSEGYDGALRQVQTLLHHANAKTTEVYLGIDIDVQARDDAIRGKRLFSSFDTKHLRAVQ